MKRVALVIGHGPKIDTGAGSRDGKVTELAWNTGLVKLIAENLERLGVTAYTVRRQTERIAPVREVNEIGAEAAIEFHLNSALKASGESASGTEMLYSGSTNGRRLAYALQNAACHALGLPDRGAKVRTTGRGAHFITKTRMPAVIAESFFVSHPGDLAVGEAMKEKLAKYYAEAIWGTTFIK